VDITDREAPKILISFPLMNSIFGPPVNLAITPDERLAIVANSVDWIQDGTSWKPQPDTKLYVLNLKTSPPSQVGTIEIGKQPSGLAINRAGNLALVANRADKSISVLSISGNDVKLVDTVAMGDEVASVAFTPDGKRALVTKFAAHKIALLTIEGQKVTNTKHDMPVGLWPYNIDVTPDGKIGISADNGNSGSPDGRDRSRRGRRRARGLRDQPEGRRGGGRAARRRQCAQERVVQHQAQRHPGRAQDRGQEGDEGR
jgi:DNA-binding beta-propeller fold protein YncE